MIDLLYCVSVASAREWGFSRNRGWRRLLDDGWMEAWEFSIPQIR